MKKIFLALAAAAALFVGCTKELEQRVGDLETSVEKLQSDLKTLEEAVAQKLVVNKMETVENGYKLTFSNGTTVTLQNGAKGDKGDPGTPGTPGAPGAPGQKGEDGDAFFESVVPSEDGAFLVVTLVADENGEVKVYKLPMGAFNIMFETSDFVDAPNAVVSVPYTVSGAKEGDVVVRVLTTKNCEAVVDAAAKTVNVTLGEGDSYVDVYAINNETGEIKAKTLTFYGYTFTVSDTKLYASPAGSRVEIPVTTDVKYDVEVDGSWLEFVKVETKAELRNDVIVLSAMDPNTSATDLTATVTLKVEGKKVAEFEVIQKNYCPQWIADENEEPVVWAESFKISKNQNMSNSETKKGTFHFELSDDFSKGAYKIVNMFYADSYYLASGAPVANQGGVWYADVESDVLTIYAEGSEKSYSFGGNLEVLYNQDEKSFSLKNSPVEVYTFNYGSGRYAYLADYNAVVKVNTPAGGESTGVEALYGEYTETFSGTWPAPKTTVISASDDSDYDVKILFFYQEGYSSHETAYGTVSADGTKITVAAYSSSNFGPVASFDITVDGNNLSSTFGGKLGYTAVKKVAFDVASLYATYTETFSGTWPAPKTTVISASDDSDYDVKILFFYQEGYSSHETAYGTVSADGTKITVAAYSSSNFGPVASFDIIVDGNNLSSTFAGKLNYSATKQ